MKKTLLSMLAGLVVIGSASAVPSPEDRKALCEKQSDKFVWVEKTQACIPINPCRSTDDKIKEAYCIDDFAGDREGKSWDYGARVSRPLAERIVRKYFPANYAITGLRYFEEDDLGEPYAGFVAFFYSDGDYKNDYVVFEFGPFSSDSGAQETCAYAACVANGGAWLWSQDNSNPWSYGACFWGNAKEGASLCKNSKFTTDLGCAKEYTEWYGSNSACYLYNEEQYKEMQAAYGNR